MNATIPPDHPLAFGRDQIERPALPGLRDVLALASLEVAGWPRLMQSIEGPVAVSFIAARMVRELLFQSYNVSLAHPFLVRLHTGNPGAAGTEHLATESTEKTFVWSVPGTVNRFISNVAAVEWVEVKAKETYTFISIGENEAGFKFNGYAELATPVAVEIGDSVRFNIGSLALEVP